MPKENDRLFPTKANVGRKGKRATVQPSNVYEDP